MNKKEQWITSIIRIMLRTVIITLLAVNFILIYSILTAPILTQTDNEPNLSNLEDLALHDHSEEPTPPDVDLGTYSYPVILK